MLGQSTIHMAVQWMRRWVRRRWARRRIPRRRGRRRGRAWNLWLRWRNRAKRGHVWY